MTEMWAEEGGSIAVERSPRISCLIFCDLLLLCGIVLFNCVQLIRVA